MVRDLLDSITYYSNADFTGMYVILTRKLRSNQTNLVARIDLDRQMWFLYPICRGSFAEPSRWSLSAERQARKEQGAEALYPAWVVRSLKQDVVANDPASAPSARGDP